MFRASTDNGATFGEKINLSNTTNAELVVAMIDADGDSVAVTWSERNSPSNEPVARNKHQCWRDFRAPAAAVAEQNH